MFEAKAVNSVQAVEADELLSVTDVKGDEQGLLLTWSWIDDRLTLLIDSNSQQLHCRVNICNMYLLLQTVIEYDW